MSASHANVTHGFLDGQPPLFASHHSPSAPSGPTRNIGWVICQPLHLDLIQCYRSMRQCAVELADAGFHVLRFHYEGTHESPSSTDLDPSRIDVWLESVRRAVLAMAKVPGVTSVGLVGVRMGALFALETATQLDVSKLVLWEPPPNGAMYAREMEILASSAPQPKGGGGVVAGGYWISQATLADFARLDPEKMQPKGKPDVLLVYRSDRKAPPRLSAHLERAGCPVTVVQPPGHKEMMVMPQKSVFPPEILTAIRDWAVAQSSEGSGTSAEPMKLAPSVVVDGLRWRAVRFGAKNHLFGVLTEPEEGARQGLPAILFLTGGVTPRTAGNNSNVTIARRLAKRGHAVLRMDVAFIGESGTESGEPGKENDPFPPSILDDARAGLARLCEAVRPGTKVWVYGLCSGAYAAFRTTLADDRISGTFIVNPERFVLDAPDAEAPQMATVDQLDQMNHYWQVMRDPQSWKKLLSGKANVRHIANVVRARVGSKVEEAVERVASKLGRAPKGLAGDFDVLLDRGVKPYLVFSEGDPGHAATVAELGARYDQLLAKGLVVKIFPGADHNFHEMDSRAVMLDWVEATITTGS